MKTLLTHLIAFLVFVVSQDTLLAWSSPGHMIVAAWAFNELDLAQQEKVLAILQNNPDYDSWKHDYENGQQDVSLNLYVVMRAATWPDEIKHKGGIYDFPNWHFVDYPLIAPDFPTKPSPTPDDDILFGLQQCRKVLADTASSAEDKAAHLCYVIHMIGDIHQPLHCATWIDGDNPAPRGDLGGNFSFIKPSTKGVNLHSFLDGQFGSSTQPDPREQLNQYTLLKSAHPRNDYEQQIQSHKTHESWSFESRVIALEEVYIKGDLPRTKTALGAKAPPLGYVKKIKAIAEDRVAIASYRLADELKSMIK